MTEMISSTDLIAEQIRVALGERLTFKQVGVKFCFCKAHFLHLSEGTEYMHI